MTLAPRQINAGIESPIGEPLAMFPHKVPLLQMGGEAKRRAISPSCGNSPSKTSKASVKVTAAPISRYSSVPVISPSSATLPR